jgi:hypothetical protein
MKRIAGIGILAVVALIAIAYTAPTPSKTTKKPPATQTPAQRRRKMMAPGDTTFMTPFKAPEGAIFIKVTGEVLDLFCYLDRGFSGEVHRDCAYRCIHGGEPMGILSRDGKVYLLMVDHWYAMDRRNQSYWRQYEQTKEYAGLMVTISGRLIKRKGISAIEVLDVKLTDEYAPPPDSIGKNLRVP